MTPINIDTAAACSAAARRALAAAQEAAQAAEQAPPGNARTEMHFAAAYASLAAGAAFDAAALAGWDLENTGYEDIRQDKTIQQAANAAAKALGAEIHARWAHMAGATFTAASKATKSALVLALQAGRPQLSDRQITAAADAAIDKAREASARGSRP